MLPEQLLKDELYFGLHFLSVRFFRDESEIDRGLSLVPPTQGKVV